MPAIQNLTAREEAQNKFLFLLIFFTHKGQPMKKQTNLLALVLLASITGMSFASDEETKIINNVTQEELLSALKKENSIFSSNKTIAAAIFSFLQKIKNGEIEDDNTPQTLGKPPAPPTGPESEPPKTKDLSYKPKIKTNGSNSLDRHPEKKEGFNPNEVINARKNLRKTPQRKRTIKKEEETEFKRKIRKRRKAVDPEDKRYQMSAENGDHSSQEEWED